MAIHIHFHDAAWEENKHPRAPDGKFGAGASHSKPILDSLRWYQHHGSATINKGLRTGKLSKTGAAAVAHIDSTFEPAKEPMVLHRGSKWIAGHVVFGAGKNSQPKVGDVFTEPAYSSTSHSEKQARLYTNATSLEIHVPKGHPVSHLSDLMGEHEGGRAEESEVLLPRNSKFKITGVEYKDGILRKVKVQLLKEES